MRNCLSKYYLNCSYCTFNHYFSQKAFYCNNRTKVKDLLLYDPITKTKIPLRTAKNNVVTWYSCGPTVYDLTHIGHASSYVRLDILRRVLVNFFEKTPVVTMCITDIDDKIITKAKLENVDFKIIAQRYEQEFLSSIEKLGVLKPHCILRVTDHVDDIIKYIQQIIQNGYAYLLDDGGVYFNTQSLSNYGKITRAPTKEGVTGKPGERLHPSDFVLWKGSKPGEPSWPSPWGPGRPGWHIECSTLASKVYGRNVNVHTGGLDLAFPHHENEEAQSCAYHSVPQWVDHWIHTGHLLMNGFKMSKSMKNFISVSEFLNKYTADHFRLLCLMTSYRTSIDYNDEVMKKPVAMIDKLHTFLSDARNYVNGTWTLGNVSSSLLFQEIERAETDILDGLADDCNTAKGINAIQGLVKTATGMLHAEPIPGAARDVIAVTATIHFVESFLHQLGLFQTQRAVGGDKSSFITDKAVSFRGKIRQIGLSLKDKEAKREILSACDTFRSDLAGVNIVVKDIGNDSSWSTDSK